MEDMIRSMADAPDDQRKSMIKERLMTFLTQEESDRQSGQKELMEMLSRLSPEQRERFVKTRTEIIASELDEEQRKKLMTSRFMAGKTAAEGANQADMMAIFKAIPSLTDEHKMAFVGTLKGIVMSMPEEERNMMLSMLPDEAKQMLGM